MTHLTPGELARLDQLTAKGLDQLDAAAAEYDDLDEQEASGRMMIDLLMGGADVMSLAAMAGHLAVRLRRLRKDGS